MANRGDLPAVGRRMKRSFFRHNGLTIVLLAFFVVTLLGQSIAGWKEFNDEQEEHGGSVMSYGKYLSSDHFWEATAENWESEFLQMFIFIALTAVLYQKGSAESKDPDKPDEEAPPVTKRSPSPVRKGGWRLRLYEHSLSLAFLGLFLLAWGVHAAAGAKAYNDDQIEHGKEAVSTLHYMATSRFWFESFQNWQSEFLAIALMVVLTIFLREKSSPESKPVQMPHEDNPE
jgi:hypothetical protein